VRPAGSGTSAGPGRRRDSAESTDTSLRFAGEVRCRIAEKIPLPFHPRELALEGQKLLVPRDTRAGEGRTALRYLTASPEQHVRAHPDVPSDLAHARPLFSRQANRLTLEFLAVLPSFSHDTPPGPR